ncbi:predicted protein, partial [Arabidopsis lyrata subsp. lyrata]
LFPVLESGWPRNVCIFASTDNSGLIFLNYTGLAIVGYAAVVLGLVSLSPFLVMSAMAIPKIKPHRWYSCRGSGQASKDIPVGASYRCGSAYQLEGMAELGFLPKFDRN